MKLHLYYIEYLLINKQYFIWWRINSLTHIQFQHIKNYVKFFKKVTPLNFVNTDISKNRNY